MAVFHDEVEIEDFEYDEETGTYSYPCPCGDRFLITREDLENGEDVATCPSCSLILRVIYDQRNQQQTALKKWLLPVSGSLLWQPGIRQLDCVSSGSTSAQPD
ncbi:DPH3 homolog isoform X1 [Corvus cornix cornix]|uniref:DPH3 homolog isoform X1 n=1 Tax=Corvus brachyrhynchos TaxID=85066 RepID=UPI0008164728|nr:PREDICTED: DPH3 homolog isoform X1 [Corvus brachyrhynchos]XP_031964536.1 DPH3 homolog isoform X1 [Corvus moneduloides]XP_039404458.1 DPH3 homolog isoform X1 [Corvus cornix cornix]XP_048158407.1 DPH3 homolog isoform X1 [Corvus hawaiiensis]